MRASFAPQKTRIRILPWWFHRWARRPERAEFGRKMDDSLGGGSLRRALAAVDEVRQFERDEERDAG